MREAVRGLPRSLLFLYAGTVATRLGTFVVPYLTVYLSAGRGMSMAATGRVIGLGSVGLVAGNLLGGQLADRIGRKPTLLLALGTNVAGVAALSGSLPHATAYTVALGVGLLGAGMYTPAANALIADRTHETVRARAYTINYVCINAGMALGPLLGGLVAASSYGWLFAIDIATSLACAGLIAFGIREAGGSGLAVWRRVVPRSLEPGTRARRGGASGHSTLAVWRRHPRVVAFCLVGGLLIAPLMGLEYSVPLLVSSVFAAPLVYVGVVYTINAVTVLALSFPLERLLRGRSELAMMAVAGGLWTAGLAIIVLGFSLRALLACTVVWTIGEVVASVVVPTYVSKRVDPEAKGRMLSLVDAVRSLCGVACPVGLGLLWDASGPRSVLVVLLALPAIGGLVYLAWSRAAGRRR